MKGEEVPKKKIKKIKEVPYIHYGALAEPFPSVQKEFNKVIYTFSQSEKTRA